jgi:acyl carrier protein
MADELALSSIEQQLCLEIQTLLSLRPKTVEPETNLPDLGIDSLRWVSLLMTIEQKFGVSLISAGLKQSDMQSPRSLAKAVLAERSG